MILLGTTNQRFSKPPAQSRRASLIAGFSIISAMTTLSDGLRQSDRVRFRMPVEVSWLTSAGVTVTHNAETLLVSRNGGVLRLAEKLSMGQELHLRRDLEGDNWKKTRARVVAEIDQDPPNNFLYAIHILDPRSDFWDIDFPAPHKAEEALARCTCGLRRISTAARRDRRLRGAGRSCIP